MRRILHRVKHWLHLERCRNYTEWRGSDLWHYLVCVECGERVLEFQSRISQ